MLNHATALFFLITAILAIYGFVTLCTTHTWLAILSAVLWVAPIVAILIIGRLINKETQSAAPTQPSGNERESD